MHEAKSSAHFLFGKSSEIAALRYRDTIE